MVLQFWTGRPRQEIVNLRVTDVVPVCGSWRSACSRGWPPWRAGRQSWRPRSSAAQTPPRSPRMRRGPLSSAPAAALRAAPLHEEIKGRLACASLQDHAGALMPQSAVTSIGR